MLNVFENLTVAKFIAIGISFRFNSTPVGMRNTRLQIATIITKR